MKKILSGFILLTLLGALVLPLGVSAQGMEVPNFCCLSHDVKTKDLTDGTQMVIPQYSQVGETGTEGAAATVEPCLTKSGKQFVRADWGLICIIDKVYNAVDWIFWILMAVTGILVLVGAFYYAFAGGDATKAAKGKQIIVAAIASLVIAMFARFIPSLVMGILG